MILWILIGLILTCLPQVTTTMWVLYWVGIVMYFVVGLFNFIVGIAKAAEKF